MPSAIIFDLDGTLLNTLRDLADSGNEVLRRMGFPTHPVDAYRYHVGDGIRMLAYRALPEGHREDEQLDAFVAQMSAYYAEHQVDTTRPYDGIDEMLDELAGRGLPLAIFSNKPDHAVKSIVARLLGRHSFAVVRGALPDVAVKPDPTGAFAVAEELGLAPGEFFFLGDTAIDMQTAVAAGMYPVGAAWGFRDEAELRAGGAKMVARHPAEVVDLASCA